MGTFVFTGNQMMSADKFFEKYAKENQTEKNEVLAYNGTDKVRVVIKEPLKNPEIKLIGTDFTDIQAVVGGYFECIPLGETHMDIYIDEEGKLKRSMPNLMLKQGNRVYDIVVGTILISKVDEEGQGISLTTEECFKAILELDRMSFKSEGEILRYLR